MPEAEPMEPCTEDQIVGDILKYIGREDVDPDAPGFDLYEYLLPQPIYKLDGRGNLVVACWQWKGREHETNPLPDVPAVHFRIRNPAGFPGTGRPETFGVTTRSSTGICPPPVMATDDGCDLSVACAPRQSYRIHFHGRAAPSRV